jgi:hypothetical protein
MDRETKFAIAAFLALVALIFLMAIYGYATGAWEETTDTCTLFC